MELIRRAATVRGRVQGVSFRYYTGLEARRLGLDGWVRNEPDGSVRLEVQGPAEGVDELLRWLRVGPPHAVVDGVEIAEVGVAPDQDGFRVGG